MLIPKLRRVLRRWWRGDNRKDGFGGQRDGDLLVAFVGKVWRAILLYTSISSFELSRHRLVMVWLVGRLRFDRSYGGVDETWGIDMVLH